MSNVILGDCLDVLPRLPQAALVYMDPPFGTGRRQSLSAGEYADPADVGGLLERILAAWERVDTHGSLVVHLDWRSAAYARVALDKALGPKYFASEIIWRYRRCPTKQRNFQRVHDTLLRYVKTPGESHWTQLYEPLASSTVKTWGDRRQNRATRTTDGPSLGCPMGDVWDIPIVAPVAKERTGYPTQKPEALLERLVLALTEPLDMVLDPYCGSGTTLAVCDRLNRFSFGVDSNPQAIEVCKRRLNI